MHFDIPFAAFELIFTAVWLMVRVIVWVKDRQIEPKREAVLLLMYVNLAVMLRLTFFPRALVDGHILPLPFDTEMNSPLWINLRPFVHMKDYAVGRDFLVNLFGNVAMFIPTGIILPVVYLQLRRFWKTLLAGAGLSLCIELAQLPFYTRSSDIDDLLLNTAGVVIGYSIFALARRMRRVRQ
ncbi:MAG: VanZ family protein [Oscillospiraceae bacterium]|nr:VanZ family protein [Oscillospiraceae bacterium]